MILSGIEYNGVMYVGHFFKVKEIKALAMMLLMTSHYNHLT